MVRMVLQWRCITNVIISLIYICPSKENQLCIIESFLFFVKVNPAVGISYFEFLIYFRYIGIVGFVLKKATLLHV